MGSSLSLLEVRVLKKPPEVFGFGTSPALDSFILFPPISVKAASRFQRMVNTLRSKRLGTQGIYHPLKPRSCFDGNRREQYERVERWRGPKTEYLGRLFEHPHLEK